MASKNRVGLYVDGDNFYKTQEKHLYFRVDAARLIEYCKQYGDLILASYYLSIDAESEGNRQSFARALMNIGYKVIRVPVKKINAVDGERTKSRLDAKMLLDIPQEKDFWDTCILCSGDSDLEDLIQRLQYNSKRVVVLSTPTAVSEDVRMTVGNNFVDLLDIREQIERIEPGVHMNTEENEDES